jgi:hypothetical protein
MAAFRAWTGPLCEHLLRRRAAGRGAHSQRGRLALIRGYYGRDAAHRYFVGSSDGGHEALALAQRFPDDFDGIVAGEPANNWAPLLGLYETWLGRVNLDAGGHQILTAEKLPALHAAVMKACANTSGVIVDPRACAFRPGSIECPTGTDTPVCLTPAQVRVVRAFYRGPTDAAGRNLFDGGEAYGSELAWNYWAVRPAADPAAPNDTYATVIGLNYLRNMAYWRNPPVTFGLRDVRFTAAAHRRLQHEGDLYNATNPDLRRFAAHGGKLIIWHGWADQAISPFESLDYYSAVVRWSGGFRRSQAFSRLYMIPGSYHCPCGIPNNGDPETVLDIVTPLVRWVRDGVAPATLTLPITHKSSGAPLDSLTVAPFNPLAPAPRNHGLNSNYRYIARRSQYRPGHELWCEQKGRRLECRRRARSASSHSAQTRSHTTQRLKRRR